MGLVTGAIAVQAAWENDFLSVRGSAISALLPVLLEGVALIRYPDTVDFGSVEAIAYLVALANIAVVGAVSLAGYLCAVQAQAAMTPTIAD